MPIAFSLVPQVAPLVARHAAAYIELVAADAREQARLLLRRVLAILVALLGFSIAVLVSCAWLIAVAWNSPWRSQAFAALILLFALVAALGASIAMRRTQAATAMRTNLQAEWAADRHLLGELAGKAMDVSAPVDSALLRLQQSRQGLRTLLVSAEAEAAKGKFPRSTTMQLLNLIPLTSLARMLFKQ
jgi:uncharacterized membrane protein YqjE